MEPRTSPLPWTTPVARVPGAGRERRARVLLGSADPGKRHDEAVVVDLDPESPDWGEPVAREVAAPGPSGDRWSRCSAPLPTHTPGALACDAAWHSEYHTMMSSEWQGPGVTEDVIEPARLLAGEYRVHLHAWGLPDGDHRQSFGGATGAPLVRRLQPAHNPCRAYGFAAEVLSPRDRSASILLWYLDRARGDAHWSVLPVITIPAVPADATSLPPILRAGGVVPPLVTDIHLSPDDRFLYLACWGTGQLRQYDVSDPFNPRLTDMVRLGGIDHPGPSGCRGGPQELEISRDGRRIYLTNGGPRSWEAAFYPEGIDGWLARVEVGHQGEMRVDRDLLVEFGPEGRPRRVRLEGGDASSDSPCHGDASTRES